uniref:Oxidoreductase FAD/NAD(P)-binding domain-containing protein n=1 Tax=Neobodo designis TaxID=312471 RepID=A0A7S1LZ81_NEODS
MDVVVYTGNRDRAKDFLYAEELQRLSDETKESPTARLAHHMALSRENPKFPSMYVQHAMVKNAAEIAAALQHPDSVFFVSGNAKRMPQDVEDTLTSIIQNRIPAHAANPAKYLRMLKQTGRLVMDTWA